MIGRLFRRRGRLPADLRPALDRTERVVAWARAGAGGAWRSRVGDGDSASGGVMVATNLGVFLPGRAVRIGWHEINKATWNGHEVTIVPAERVQEHDAYLVVADGPPLSVPLPDPGKLPDHVRTRVTRSVSYASHEPFPDGGGVLIVARRVPGVDGVTWVVRYDPATDPRAAGVAVVTAHLVAAHAAARAAHAADA